MQQRIIRLRAWHEREPRALSPVSSIMLDNPLGSMLVYTCDYAEPWQEDDCVLMQYTGLMDKNGTEIYEGDIVHFRLELFGNVPTTLDYVSPVEMVSGCWSVYQRGAYTPQGQDKQEYWTNLAKWLETKPHCVEVIGNSMENPELIGEIAA